MFWIFIVALHIYIVMYVYQAEAERSKLERLEKFYHIIAWGIPFILLIIAISADVFGDSGQWCWISPDYQWARIALYVYHVCPTLCREINDDHTTNIATQVLFLAHFDTHSERHHVLRDHQVQSTSEQCNCCGKSCESKFPIQQSFGVSIEIVSSCIYMHKTFQCDQSSSKHCRQ